MHQNSKHIISCYLQINFLEFEAIRGIASICVVLSHYNPYPFVVKDDSGFGVFINIISRSGIGNLAVIIFFSLSAFLISFNP